MNPDVAPASSPARSPCSPVDFRALFEGLPNLLLVLDRSLCVVAATDAYLAALRVKREEVIGRYAFEVFPVNPDLPGADSFRQVRASFERVLRTGETDAMVMQRHDVPRPVAEGGGFAPRYWSPINSPLRGPDGTVGFVIHRIEDVTDYILQQQAAENGREVEGLRDRTAQVESELYARSREVAETSLKLKQANAELARLYESTQTHEMEARYREWFDAIDAGFCTIEVLFDGSGRAIDYRFLEVNPAFAHHTGIHEAKGRRMREIAPHFDEHWFRIYGEVARTGRPVRFAEHATALERWFEVFAVRVGAPELHQVAVLFTDVTERQQTLRALRKSEERFRAVADNIPQLAWMTDADGKMLWFNRRWFEYTGRDLEEMRRVGWGEVHHPEHPTSVVEGWQRALRTGEAWEDTFPLRGRDGSFRWFLSRAFPIRDEQGRISQWFGTNTDITLLRETQAALKKAHEDLQRHALNLENVVAERTAQLSEKVQELEAFSYSLSHDMRAPLRAMQGYSHILESDHASALGEEGRRFVRRISAAAARLDQLIQDVLAYSRVVREPMELRPIDTGRLVRQLVDENPALQWPQANIVLCEPFEPVLGHEACLMQVVSNLVYNAVKFVAPGRQPHVRIWTEAKDRVVELFVSDNGVGIPHEGREKIFGMFQRMHSNKAFEGTGIGLAIVRKAVERMGGTVRVESEPWQGSTFIVQLRSAKA